MPVLDHINNSTTYVHPSERANEGLARCGPIASATRWGLFLGF